MARFRRNRSPRVVALTDLEQGDATLSTVGTTGMALLEARRLGMPLLETFVIGAGAFRDLVRQALPPGHDPASLLRVIHRPPGLERAARARERLLAVELPENLSFELGDLLKQFGDQARWGLRVRASSTCADPSMVAMAGLEYEAFGIRDLAGLEHHVRCAWASCFQADSLRYLRAFRVRDVAVAVLIEPIEPVAATGTLLTQDPRVPTRIVRADDAPDDPGSEQRVAVRVASASLGLGAPVIDGASARDLFRFAGTGEIIEARIAAKRARWIVSDAGLELQSLPADKMTRPALKAKTIAELLTLAKRLDAAGPSARKVEFLALRGGGVRVSDLQPLTGSGWPEGGSPATVWSRVGLGESVPGVPTPLTASLAQAFEAHSLSAALESLGGKGPRSPGLVRPVYGRFYANITQLLPAIDELPGVDPEALLELIAGEDARLMPFQAKYRQPRTSLARLSLVASRLSTQQRRLTDEVQRFEHRAEQQRRWLAEMDLAILPDDALKTTLLETHDFFLRTSELLLSSSLAMIAAHLGLRSVLSRSSPVSAEHLAQVITSGVGELDSSALGIALAHVIAIADKDAAARPQLASGQIKHPSELPHGPARRAIQQYLDAYGERAVRETELCTARFAEAPEPVLAMIRAGLSGPLVDPDQRLSNARVVADRALATLEARLPYLEKTLLVTLVARARVFTRMRERMRIWLARTLNMLRIVTLDIDRRLGRLDSSLTPGAAFFCTLAELVSAVGSYRADLGPLVRLRRASYERDAERLDPPETFVGTPWPWAVPPLGSVVLHGRGASSGVVIGRARLVGPRAAGAEALRPGEILVMRNLDVGLAPLLLIAGGVVSELGGSLSHGAVVAREYGLPAVVCVPAVTTTVQDGERLRIDGERGVVERLDA